MSETRVAEKPKLLIVEDDLDVAEMLGAYFRVQGYDVQLCHWGEEALRLSSEAKPDLVILDIRLPDIDGFEVAHRLRSDRHTDRIPILFLTERREREDRLRGLALGADDYITKPFDIQELRLRVRNALRRSDQPSLLNPVTGLPEPSLSEEHLAERMQERDWGALAIHLAGLDTFREDYGFVMCDDTLRAASLLVTNIVADLGDPGDFVGHLGPASFLVITSRNHVQAMHERLGQHLAQALAYFYPLRDRPEPTQPPRQGPLDIRVTSLTPEDGAFEDAAAVRQALLAAIGD